MRVINPVTNHVINVTNMKLSEKPQGEQIPYTGEGSWPTQIVRGDLYYNKLQELPDSSRAWYVQWSKLENDIQLFVVMWKDRSGKVAKKEFPAAKGNYSRGWDQSEQFFYSSFG